MVFCIINIAQEMLLYKQVQIQNCEKLFWTENYLSRT